MRISTLLKLMFAAALPLYATDDETASAVEAKPEVEDAGNVSGASTAPAATDGTVAGAGISSGDAPTIGDVLEQGDAAGNVGVLDAEAKSANDTPSSAASALSEGGIAGDQSQDSERDDDWLTAHQAEYDNGLKCSLHGLAVADMSREQLIAFIGFLDTALVGVGTRFAEA